MKYLLSPQDLAAYDLIPGLIAAGVCSLKIEGRLKTPEYVANITRHYRQAIDSAVAGRPVRFTPRQIEEMELSFSRGFSPGWLEGCDHKTLVPGESSAKRGVLLGEVRSAAARTRAGRADRLDRQAGRRRRVRRRPSPWTTQGGRVYEVFRDGGPCERAGRQARRSSWRSAHGAIDFEQVWVGPDSLEDRRSAS